MMRRAAGVVACWILVTALPAAEVESNPRDTLVYQDGDRVQGRLVKNADGMIDFQSDRFGPLRVAAQDVVIIPAEKPVAAAAAPAKAVAAETEDERISAWEWFSPWVLTARMRKFFGPWHGRFALSAEVITDSAQRQNLAGEGHLRRKWKSDEVQLNSRYDFSKTNGLVTTDVLNADGSWHHDFSEGKFALYRPAVEWNRASTLSGVPNKYVLLHQEIGGGLSVLATASRKVRIGLSENLFQVWNYPGPPGESSRSAESVFEEVEWKLPWRMSVTQRGVWYNPFYSSRDGWEDTIELNKKLSETFSVSVRHEIRRNNPDGSSQNYTRLKLLLGLDF